MDEHAVVSRTLSVAMCTFNGVAFVEEQLRSIAAQNRRPDELVVSDDGSVDGTADVVAAFAESAPFPVRLTVNERRLGSVKNFEKAISGCNGELIALADQDDVWRADKLALQERALEAEELHAVFSDADVVGPGLEPLGFRMWETQGFNEHERTLLRGGHAVSVLLKMDVVTGSTLVFRSALRDMVLPVPEAWVHDAWIALVVAATGRLGYVTQPLVRYRQHGQNLIGAVKRPSTLARFARALTDDGRTDEEAFAAQLRRYRAGAKRLREIASGRIDATVLTDVSAKTHHVSRRLGLPPAKLRRVPIVLGELASGRYRRYSFGWRSAGKDLLLR